MLFWVKPIRRERENLTTNLTKIKPENAAKIERETDLSWESSAAVDGQ